MTQGGPADDAGIRGGEPEDIEDVPGVPKGDVITEVEGEQISTFNDVIRIVNASEPGDRLTMTVVSPNEDGREVEVTVGSRSEGT